jgi:hypothetical protein
MFVYQPNSLNKDHRFTGFEFFMRVSGTLDKEEDSEGKIYYWVLFWVFFPVA